MRTGMAGLGVPEIVSEHVLAHAIGGLTKIYNVHAYENEKRDALERWARHLHNVVTPPPENVVKLVEAGR